MSGLDRRSFLVVCRLLRCGRLPFASQLGWLRLLRHGTDIGQTHLRLSLLRRESRAAVLPSSSGAARQQSYQQGNTDTVCHRSWKGTGTLSNVVLSGIGTKPLPIPLNHGLLKRVRQTNFCSTKNGQHWRQSSRKFYSRQSNLSS